MAFSVDPIKHVLVRIDKEYKWRNCIHVDNSPLYIVKWDYSTYLSGLHTINVSDDMC